MATERLSMHKTREILRLKWSQGRSHREVVASLGVSLGTVTGAVQRAAAAGLDWPAVQALADDELDRRVYVGAAGGEAARPARPLPDCAWIHAERRRPGVTLELLHLEYRERHPDGYGYTQFCEAYRRWLATRGLTMRQVHRAGEKLFTDYSGKRPHLVDAATGEVRPVELFVAVLGASNYTFAEATATQRSHDWIASHSRAVEFLGGVPELVVPDQLRSAVTAPCRYEPGLQRTFEEWARHYGTAILPARPGHARDKAKVEVGVQIAQRWILARLRHQTFFSLDELNARIAELLDELNDRRMRVYGASRRELFLRLDLPALRPLPADRFVYAEWKRARVNLDYHVEVDHHFYSAPHPLVHEDVEVRFTATTVEILRGGQRVASHARSYVRGGHTTVPEHMPKAHQKHLEWSPSRFRRWAATIGPQTEALVTAILAERPHPEQGYRSCLGLLHLTKRYEPARVEAACARAVAARARSYRHVASILKNGLDRVPPPDSVPPAPAAPAPHEHIRGRDYYN